MRLKVEFLFHSAHSLPYYNGHCKNLHGHTYKMVVTIKGAIDPQTGMVMDFVKLREIIEENVLKFIDHAYLNDILENPTAENLIIWIWKKIIDYLPNLEEIELYETPKSSVIYRGE